MSYTLTTRPNKISISVSPNSYETKVLLNKINVSLARTGGQGSIGPAGRSVTNAAISNNRLIFSFSDGTTIDVGSVPALNSLSAVALSGLLTDIIGGTLDTGIISGGYYGN